LVATGRAVIGFFMLEWYGENTVVSEKYGFDRIFTRVLLKLAF
jgi:hypothetical protein